MGHPMRMNEEGLKGEKEMTEIRENDIQLIWLSELEIHRPVASD